MKVDKEFDANMDRFITAYENFVESLANLRIEPENFIYEEIKN
jgi:hypothetical protein